jgi:hypothetical protein
MDLESVMVDICIFFIFGGKLIPQQSAATLQQEDKKQSNSQYLEKKLACKLTCC